MAIFFVIFFCLLSSGIGSFHRGFTYPTDGFRAALADNLKGMSCPTWSPHSSSPRHIDFDGAKSGHMHKQLNTLRTSPSLVAATTPFTKTPNKKDDQVVHPLAAGPALAVCFDFDQTLSQTHIHLSRRTSSQGKDPIIISSATSNEGFLRTGVDYVAAFGGRERILRLRVFLDYLRSFGAAMHIVSHGNKDEIVKV